MRALRLTAKFKRSFRKFAKRNVSLQDRIESTLQAMRDDLYAPALGTHKLSGQLEGFQSCSCGYDCRIIFSLEQDSETGDEVVVLLDIGTHDDVY